METRLSSTEKIRIFKEDISSEELTWHRDRHDRIVEVISCGDWYLQHDGSLPVKMKKGCRYDIPKNSWHRVIKKSGCGDLVVKITEIHDD